MYRLKRLLLDVFILSVAVILPLCYTMTAEAASDVTVNLSSTKQSISGFGASSAWCGAINDSVMNSLYGNLGYSILRLRIEEGIGDKWKSGNFSDWAAELSNAKKASAKGAKIFASPWNPPASMQESFSKSGDPEPKRLRYDKYAEYVQYLNAYVKYMKDNGVNLYAISVQNEPDYAQDWTWWTPTEMLNFMKNNAGSINCKVMAPESFQFLKNMSDPILNDATALSNMDILGCHFYGTSTSNMAYPLFQQKGAGKELWMTEKYFDDDTIDNIMKMSKEIHDSMVTGNMNAYVYWWITWPNGLANSSGTIFKRAYVLGQFSKFIRPGFNRVDATANPNTNVYVSAYTGDNKVTIVAINTGTSAVSQKFNLQGGSTSTVSSYITDSGRNMASGSSISVSGGSFTAQLPAQSITTFVGNLDNIPSILPSSTSTSQPTSTPTPTSGARSAFSQIEAEEFNTQSGIQTETCSEGGEDVGYIEDGDYVAYNNINFGSGAESFQVRTASGSNGGNIEIRLDSITGPLVGTCPVTGNGDWQTWVTATCDVSGVSGVHDLYLKFTGGSGYLFNLNWWKFGAVDTTSTPVKSIDVNHDGAVNISDVMIVVGAFNTVRGDSRYVETYDLNSDGAVNITDIMMIAAKFNTIVPTEAPTAIPTAIPTVTPTVSARVLPSVDSVERDGPFSTVTDKNVGPSNKGVIVRPASLGSLGVNKHPIFIWGPGGGSDPLYYELLIRRLASMGFVVYSEVSTGDGTEMKAALNWIISQNSNPSSPYYNELDTSRIGAGGHSLGSGSAYGIADDPRISTTIHCDGGSLDGTGASRMRKPTALLCGLADNLALGNTDNDYKKATVPIWYGGIKGGGHGAGPFDGIPAVVAWARWQIAGETERKSMFIGSGAVFNTGIWQSQYKNW